MRAGWVLLVATVQVTILVGCLGSDVRQATTTQALNPAPTPTPGAFGVLGNGAVSTIVPHGNVTYIGGNFDELAAITGAFARLDSATAKRIAPLAEAEHGEVRASASDGQNGFLSSNSKCNTASPEGLWCCYAHEILPTLDCGRP